jgi:hypothetical protein
MPKYQGLEASINIMRVLLLNNFKEQYPIFVIHLSDKKTVALFAGGEGISHPLVL